MIRPGRRVTAAWRSLSVGKLMRVDPRLQRLVDLMERASASQHAGSSGEFGRRFEEFITAAQAISDIHQETISRRVTKRVVDDLEIVEVQE